MKGTAYLIQSFLILFWWMGIWWNENLFAIFQYAELSPVAFKALFVPDVLLIAGLSLIRGYKEWRNLELIILGAFAFITLYCIQLSLVTQSGFLSTVIMILGLFYNIFLVFNPIFFKESQTQNVYINSLKTLIQIVVVWGIMLVIIPVILVSSFGHIIQEVFQLNSFGIIVLGMGSVLGIWSAVFMVKNGKGTPLPLNQTQRLVIAGPYKYVRNPMAVAGIFQGIGVSILLNSWPVFLYALLGAVLWNYVVRPIEEANLESRFGEAYIQYKKKIRCWIPNMF